MAEVLVPQAAATPMEFSSSPRVDDEDENELLPDAPAAAPISVGATVAPPTEEAAPETVLLNQVMKDAQAVAVAAQQTAEPEEEEEEEEEVVAPAAAAPVVSIAKQKEAIIASSVSPEAVKKDLAQAPEKPSRPLEEFNGIIANNKKESKTASPASGKQDVLDVDMKPAAVSAAKKNPFSSMVSKMAGVQKPKAKAAVEDIVAAKAPASAPKPKPKPTPVDNTPPPAKKVTKPIAPPPPPTKVGISLPTSTKSNKSSSDITGSMAEVKLKPISLGKGNNNKNSISKKGTTSESEDSNAEEESSEEMDPLTVHQESDYQVGKPDLFKEPGEENEEEEEEEDSDKEVGAPLNRRASLSRPSKSFSCYLLAESKAAQISGIQNSAFYFTTFREGKAESENKKLLKKKNPDITPEEVEEGVAIAHEMNKTGLGFFTALKTVLDQTLCTLSSKHHPDWITEDPLDKAYDRAFCTVEEEEEEAAATAKDEDGTRKESKDLIRHFLRYFGGSTMAERDMIGPDEFCMILEGRRLLSWLVTEKKVHPKFANFIFKGRILTLEPQVFHPTAGKVKCVITGNEISDPKRSVLLWVRAKDKKRGAVFLGYVEREWGLLIQTASFACNPLNNIKRDFKEYLCDECQFTVVKVGTKAERKKLKSKNHVIYVEPPLVEKSQVDLFVQAYCDTAPYLFGQYWDTLQVLKQAISKGNFLHNYPVLKDYLAGEEEYGPETLAEIEKKKVKEAKAKEASRKKAEKRRESKKNKDKEPPTPAQPVSEEEQEEEAPPPEQQQPEEEEPEEEAPPPQQQEEEEEEEKAMEE